MARTRATCLDCGAFVNGDPSWSMKWLEWHIDYCPGPPEKKEKVAVAQWLEEETNYQVGKWPDPEHDRLTREQGTGKDTQWFNDVTQYMHRASVLGLDNPAGRQALMKALSTMHACAESMIRCYGKPPVGGFPSGEVH